ncbi:MAG: hypothetical protein Kow0068_10460 [Marinilabiliales bacterium]
MLLLDKVWEEQERNKCINIFLRDFDAEDTKISNFYTNQGFVKINLPENNHIETSRFISY